MSEVFNEDRRARQWFTVESERAPPTIIPAPASRHQPFPLTDLQKAYWLGRTDYFELGNIGCHIYVEVDLPGVDRRRLQAAWEKLIDRHEMLRAVIRDDGLQQVLPHTPHYDIKHLDLRDADQAKTDFELAAIRNRMSHQVFSPDRWPLFEMRTTELKERTLLHFSCDLLFIDIWSLQILHAELIQLAYQRVAHLAPLEISFRDYVLTAAQQRNSKSYRRAEQYWLRRLETLPAAPKLPLAKNPVAVTQPRFVRREAMLDHEVWRKLKSRSAKARTSLSGTLLAAFARVLAAWSQSPHFTLNTTLFQRASLHPHVHRLVGDFTSILLLEVHDGPEVPFDLLVKRMTAQFRSDLKHREYGGLTLLHEIAKRGDPDRPPSMPVVFTSALAPRMPGWQSADRVGEISHGVSQTPQVYLDHQVYQRGGHLYLSWDAVEELFPPGLLDDMFGAYCAFLQRLALDEAAWRETKADLLPSWQVAQRVAVNDTAGPLPQGLLHEPFLDQVRKRPDHTAIATWERRLTYNDVHRHARCLARRLRQLGAGPNRLVALVMEKGWEQVVGAIAVLEAGGAYLPVDPDLPQERRWFLLRQGEVEIVLTQPCIEERLEWPSGVQCLSVEWQSPGQEEPIEEPLAPSACETDLAYVIFTSGSTGEPKGVMIEHRSALNTALDINQRCGVNADDRIFALSSLSFDLSVYDIFGALAAGATIVVPHPMSAREPGDWADIVRRERVTIWNSVPALLEMWVDHLESRQNDHSIRLALLSGDWIPVGLPDRARAVLPGLQLLGLGGATEGSIWSISYPIVAVSKDWRSIPYGQPLRNQQMHVLNEEMTPCPTWVPGQIHIGGIGLARGYWRDEAKTRAQFVSHPQSGERLYRTGDLGRYLPDGNIEFLGREDDQVKVQGYRIELGEIEATLERHPEVKSAVVMAVGERAAPKHLVAYVVTHGIAIEDLANHLRQHLPEYMVPAVWQELDALPLTPNGKVNRKALPSVARPPSAQPAPTQQQPDVLARITALIAQELALPSVDPRKNLLSLGATSMDLVRIVGRLQKELNFRPSFQEFLRDPSAAALAERYQENSAIATKAGTPAAVSLRRSFDLILDPAAKEAFRRENHGIRAFPDDWGRLRLDDAGRPSDLEDRTSRRRAVRHFRSEAVPLAALGALLAELSRVTKGDTEKYGYGSAGGLYPVQTYLHAKPDGVAGLPTGTFYYHPVEHCLVPITLGAELDAEIHEPFTNRPAFEQARFSLFFVHQPRAIEPIYGDLAWRFSLLEAGAMAHAVETSAWRYGLGLCPIGWLDFARVRGLLQLEDGQELLHAHVGGLLEMPHASGDWEEGVI
ncbi:MAG TPA: amino acid adenylation domain-containing protein [Xanthobacteraceae bacterium]|nr:amino acid adenylation domain-containing protein [Xanthobacteraceae bacterium]